MPRLLELLDDAEQRTVLAAAHRRRFARGEVVFHDGDPGDTLHLIVKGHFAVRMTTPLGDVATLRVCGPGEHFGELAVLAPGPRIGSVVSLDGGDTMALHRDTLGELRARMPRVDAALADALIAEIRRLAVALVDALYVPTEQRVWRRLSDLVGIYRSGDGDGPVVIAVTQDDFAQLVGTTRSTANRVLRSGEDKGVIVLARGRIEVHDLEGLALLAR